MHVLTNAQLTALKNDIAADPALSVLPKNSDSAEAIAKAYNTQVVWTIWKTSVPLADVGLAFNASELAGLTQLNLTRLNTIATYRANGINPSLPSNRQFFDDVFSGAGGTNTRPALLALWKKQATRGQKLYSTGTGSDAVPATLASNVPDDLRIERDDVEAAWSM